MKDFKYNYTQWTRLRGLTWTVIRSIITLVTFQLMTDWRVTTIVCESYKF